MKNFYFFIVAILISNFNFGQTVLNPGEVMIVGFYSDALNDCEDGFAFISYVPLAPDTQIRFSEEDYNEWGTTLDSEGDLTWTNTTGKIIPALTRINITTPGQSATLCSGTTPVAEFGSAVYEKFFTASSWGLNGDNEEIIVYQGTSNRVITTAISLFLSDRATAVDNTPPTLLTTSFIVNFDRISILMGMNTVSGDDVDLAVYTGPAVFTDFNDFVSKITSLTSNWAIQNNGGGNDDGKDTVFPDYPKDLKVFAGNVALSTNSFEFSKISIYPNPVSDNLTISSTEVITAASIYNTLGKVVYDNQSFSNTNNQINISNLQSGTYFLKVSSGKNTQNLKFIKL